MNQMRELFEKWAKSECLDTDSVDGFYSDNDTHIAWGSWQAAQSVSVPVVGDVVAYLKADSTGKILWSEDCVCVDAVWAGEDSEFGEYSLPLIVQPTTSISAAELERLQQIEAIAKTAPEISNCNTIGYVRFFERLDAAIAGEKK